MTYRIKCEVSGGPTGYRTGYLKNAHGAIETFTDREAAQTRARELYMRNNGPYRTANFRYTVEAV